MQAETETPVNIPQADWIEEFHALPLEKMSAWFADIGGDLEVRKATGGIAVHFGDGLGKYKAEPTVTFHGTRMECLCNLLVYVGYMPVSAALQSLLEAHPELVRECPSWRWGIDPIFPKSVGEDLLARAEAANV